MMVRLMYDIDIYLVNATVNSERESVQEWFVAGIFKSEREIAVRGLTCRDLRPHLTRSGSSQSWSITGYRHHCSGGQ